MKRKIAAILMVLALAVSLTACGGGEETTVSGMVVGVEDTVISLVQMDGQMEFGGARFPGGENSEMPTRPEGMEDFNPEDMEGFDPEKMEDFNFEDFDPEDMPEGFGGGMPPEGQRPEMGSFENMDEATTLDIANAHISIEIEGGKESGTLNDIVPGTFVTVTVSSKGEATYVLVSQSMGFGGFGNFPAMK